MSLIYFFWTKKLVKQTINIPTKLIKFIFSSKKINPNIVEYIIKNVDRSYEKILKFLKDIDELSLSSGKSININLIKKLLNK